MWSVLDAEEVEELLHRDPDRGAASPHSHDEARAEAAVEDLHAEAEGVLEQGLGADVGLGHCRRFGVGPDLGEVFGH